MQIKKTIQLEKTDLADIKKIAEQALLQSATEAAAFGSEQAITLFELTTRQVAYVAAMTTKNGKTHGILRNPEGQCIAELIGSATVIAKALAKELDSREGVKPTLNSKVSCEKDLADIMAAVRKSAMEAANLNIHASTVDVTDAYGNTVIRLAIINDSAGRVAMVNIVHENGEVVGGCTRTGNQENAPETLAVLAIEPLIRTARKKPEKRGIKLYDLTAPDTPYGLLEDELVSDETPDGYRHNDDVARTILDIIQAAANLKLPNLSVTLVNKFLITFNDRRCHISVIVKKNPAGIQSVQYTKINEHNNAFVTNLMGSDAKEPDEWQPRLLEKLREACHSA